MLESAVVDKNPGPQAHSDDSARDARRYHAILLALEHAVQEIRQMRGMEKKGYPNIDEVLDRLLPDLASALNAKRAFVAVPQTSGKEGNGKDMGSFFKLTAVYPDDGLRGELVESELLRDVINDGKPRVLDSIDEPELIQRGEVVNGVTTDHYRFSSSELPGMEFVFISEATGDVWVSQEGDYVVKMTMTGTGTMPEDDDNDTEIGTVMDRIDHRRHGGVKEGGVAAGRQYRAIEPERLELGEAAGQPDAGTHGVNRLQGAEARR